MEGLGIISVYQRFPHAFLMKRSTCTVFLSLYCMERGIMLRLVILFWKGLRVWEFESCSLSPSWNVVSTWRRLHIWTCCLIGINMCAHLLVHIVCTCAFNSTSFTSQMFYIPLSVTIFPSVCLSVPVYLSIGLSILLLVCLSICLVISCLYVCPSIQMFAFLMFICLSIACLFQIYWLIFLSICVYVLVYLCLFTFICLPSL